MNTTTDGGPSTTPATAGTPVEQAVQELAEAIAKHTHVARGKETAQGLLIDAVLIALCKSLPSLRPQIEQHLRALAAWPQDDLEPEALAAFHKRTAAYLEKLELLS